MKIEVREYSTTWPAAYSYEEKQIKSILGDKLINAFHIGSTSVPGLAAKPVIDILLVMQTLADIDQFTLRFEALRYEVMGEFGVAGRRYFRKGKGTHTYHIHAFGADDASNILRHLAFRDYLRSHSNVCASYAILKADLSEKYPEDKTAYNNGKESFVHKTEQNALRWYWGNYSK